MIFNFLGLPSLFAVKFAARLWVIDLLSVRMIFNFLELPSLFAVKFVARARVIDLCLGLGCFQFLRVTKFICSQVCNYIRENLFW